MTLRGKERHLLSHSLGPRMLLIGTFQECGREFCSLLSDENELQPLWMETSFQAAWLNSIVTSVTSLVSRECGRLEEARPRNIMIY